VKQQEPGAHVDALLLSLREATRMAPLSKQAGDLDALLEMDPARRAELRAQAMPPPNLADAAHEHVGRMRKGRFEVRPLTCDYCDLEPACRLVSLPTDPDENGGEVARV
jgi:hypothetical protein